MLASYQPGRRAAAFGQRLCDRLRKHQLKGLILAQNERWRRGLGMQDERIPGATRGEVAKGAVSHG